MKHDYLWDRAGEPDPEIQKLETALAKFKYQGAPPAFPEAMPSVQKLAPPRTFRAPQFAALAVLAATVLAIAAFGIFKWRSKEAPGLGTDWGVVRLSGSPRVGSQAIDQNSGTGGLGIGQTLETDGESRATLTANAVGEISVEPNTRLRLLRTNPGRQRLALDRGTIHATIWAPPGEFVVDTPSARVIDLGCAYTLHVDDSGAGLVRTTIGWVGFKLAERESFIPAGAVCATRPKLGPGTPYFEDAAESFRAALSAFDFGGLAPEQRGVQLDSILNGARQRDALTLWHLLGRADTSERERVYQHLAALVPPPQGVTREGISHLDQPMLDSWWSKLGYGDVSLWRTFERSWSQVDPPANR